jgi:hypothetical protein
MKALADFQALIASLINIRREATAWSPIDPLR